ncbi:MAG: VWA domain-containing protein [Myxococcota bacterium]
MSLEFAYPWVLLLLLVVPVLGALMFMPSLRHKRTGTFTFSRASSLKGQVRGIRRYLEPVPNVLALLAMVLMIIGLARPQSVEPEQVEVEGIDIYLALDMSGSMEAVDKSRSEVQNMLRKNNEPDNRFESAVEVLSDFVRSREYDRIGMVVFAKEAFLQFPLTLDYNTILEMLGRLKIGDIDPQGTAIGNAIGRAVAGLKESDAKTKIMILITDGDRRGGNISPMQAADIAKDLDIKVFPILVGSRGPTLVPVTRRSLFGQTSREYRETKFPVNPELLQDIAARTDGEFYRATDADGLEERIHEILDRFERTQIKDASNVDRAEHFQAFVIASMLLLAVQALLSHVIIRKFP